MSNLDEKLAPPALAGQDKARATLAQLEKMSGRIVVLATTSKGVPTVVLRHPWTFGPETGGDQKWCLVSGTQDYEKQE